ncbi:hypothetical protein GGR53DRAFT_527970 [Hypoxylon sp. FL1150]|nr:hypothetical protein GGR53DRAFT_527970 [Hypoxylon sp. FL1150]
MATLQTSSWLRMGTKEITLNPLLEDVRHRRSLRDHAYDVNTPRETPAEIPNACTAIITRVASPRDLENARPGSPRLPPELVSNLPALRSLDCGRAYPSLSDCARSATSRGRGKARDRTSATSSVTLARLWFWEPSALYADKGQSVEMPDLVHSNNADSISLGLRTAASHLEEFDVRVILTSDLFRASVTWPPLVSRRHLVTREQHYPPVGSTELDEEYVEDEASDEAPYNQDRAVYR